MNLIEQDHHQIINLKIKFQELNECNSANAKTQAQTNFDKRNDNEDKQAKKSTNRAKIYKPQ